jgi:hypothetical protein
LVIVRCKECGKEYQLKSSDNPSDFQCDCGGYLEYKIETTSKKQTKGVSDFRKTIDNSSKKKYKSKKSYNEDFKKLRKFIEDINKSINPLALVAGLVVSIIVLIIASFIFGALLVITGIDSIIFYGTITLVTMTLIGGIVTSFLGSHHLNEGAINGTILSILLLIGMGLIVGFVLFVVIGFISSLMSSFSSIEPSAASNATSGSATNSITSWMNIVYGIVGIILTLIAGAGGGALGVIIKKKLKIPL